jgi:hypothetical protein
MHGTVNHHFRRNKTQRNIAYFLSYVESRFLKKEMKVEGGTLWEKERNK